MRKTVFFVLSVVICFPGYALAESSMLAELLVGNANQVSDTGNNYRRLSGADKSVGLRGTYQLGPSFSLEATYQYYGEAVDRNALFRFGETDVWGRPFTPGEQLIITKMQTKALNFGIVGTLSVSEHLVLLSRVGISSWRHEVQQFPLFRSEGRGDEVDQDQIAKLSDGGEDLYYGIGAKYHFAKNFFASLDFTFLGMDMLFRSSEGESLEVENKVKDFSLSFGYRL